MKSYVAERQADGRLKVHVDNGTRRRPLPPRNNLFNHSPDGFECGYHGSGPAQLALAILADYIGDDDLAVHFHQGFKADVIACQPRSWKRWCVTGDMVQQWLDKQVPR